MAMKKALPGSLDGVARTGFTLGFVGTFVALYLGWRRRRQNSCGGEARGAGCYAKTDDEEVPDEDLSGELNARVIEETAGVKTWQEVQDGVMRALEKTFGKPSGHRG